VGDAAAALLAIALLAAEEYAPARKLPPVTTVCRAATGGRCWTEPGDGRCVQGHVFRTVIVEPGRRDGADGLAACREPPPAR
jgi:hypothetical protein